MLQKMQKRLANKDRKGFTLVEVIVVLVILAILAAIMIPALTGYIDKARERSVIAETRAAVMAAQTIASTKYASETQGTTVTFTDSEKTEVKTLSEVEGTLGDITCSGGKVNKLVYTDKTNSKTCTYTWDSTAGSKYETADASKTA